MTKEIIITCDEETCEASGRHTSAVVLSRRLIADGWDLLELSGWNGQLYKALYYCPEHAKD